MSLDAMKVIQEAEEQAEELRREAVQRARELVRQAETEGDDYLTLMTRQAQEEGEGQLARARDEAAKEIASLEQENQQVCQDIMGKAETKLPEAVAFIMGRIVKSDGHR